MKKILIFSLAYYPYVSGAEIAVKEVTDRIAHSEIAFDMVTLRFKKSDPLVETIGNVRVHRVSSAPGYLGKILFPIFAALAAYRLNRKQRYDVFWVMMSYMLFPVVLLRLFGIRVPYVLTLQEGDPFEQVFKQWYIHLASPLLYAGFRSASRVQVISNFLGEWARRMEYRGDVVLIPNAVNTKHFSQYFSDEVLESVRVALHKKPGDIFLITTSRLVKKNACDDVIKALPRLPHNVHFIILGTGPDEEALRALSETLGVSKRVRFVGFVDHSEMPKYLKVSDIFIRPSLSEGFGSSFVEAFAAEIPVIATQEGGIADFLFDPERNPGVPATGRAVDARDPEGIARAVRMILDDTEATKNIIKNAHELAFLKYDWNIVAHDMKTRMFDV